MARNLLKLAAAALLALGLFLVGRSCLAGKQLPSADMVFLNGSIYTMDAARTWKQAVAIAGGKIVAVGSNKEIRAWIGPATRVIDLDGKMMLPGLHDSHVHLVDGGVHLDECNLDHCKTREEALETIRAYASEHPEKKWITGAGWSLPLFPGGSPRKEDLDAIDNQRPIYMESQDYHSGWVNSKALELAGVTEKTENPEGGVIEKSPANGAPTGTLREDAMNLVSHLIPKKSPEELVRGLRKGQELAARLGITSIQDASVTPAILRAYADLDSKSQLTVKVTAAIKIEPSEPDEKQVEHIKKLMKSYSKPRLRVTSAKIFADGVIEAKTAVLLEPYLDDKHKCPELNFKQERLDRLVSVLNAAGVQVHVHAIGDGAVRSALDAFQHSSRKNGIGKQRNHIAHLELVDEKDLGRFQELRVGANVQAYWAQRDTYISKLTEPILGEKRSHNIYPFRSLHDSGARLIGGSDWPVTTLNPFDAIEVAITRRDPKKPDQPAWLPHQSLDLQTCLEAYTINGAFINRHDSSTGSIEQGKAADLIVLDQNLFSVPAGRIHATRVLLTLVDGVEVFREPGFQLGSR